MHELIEEELSDLFAVPFVGIRIQNALLNNGEFADGEWRHKPITTMLQLLALTENELLRCDAFGRRSLDMLKQALAERGLRLAYTWSPPIKSNWRDVLDEFT